MHDSLKLISDEFYSEKLDGISALLLYPELVSNIDAKVGLVFITNHESPLAYILAKGEVAGIFTPQILPAESFDENVIGDFFNNKLLKLEPLTESGLPKPPRYSEQYKKLKRKKW